MRAAAIIAAYAAAFFFGNMTVSLLRPIVKMPDIILSALGGAILAFLVYALVASVGSILFKRTAQQSSGAVRLVYGLSGALVGFLFGAFFIWLVLVGIRSLGSIAEATVRARPANDPARNASPPPNRNQSEERASSFDPDSIAPLLARLKNSVEMGALGDFVKKTDAMPPGVYQTLTDVGTVFSNSESARRFLAFPGAAELSEHPKIVALRNDPEIMAMIEQGRLVELLRDPRILDAANDPALAERVKKFDLKNALEYAARKN
jgi:hypothetical protein